MNKLNQEIEELLSEVNNISEVRDYWLVRTMGGEYYNYYVNNSVISIGYNEISLDEIRNSFSFSNPIIKLKEIIESKNTFIENEDDEISAAYAAPQLIKFYSEIKNGDIVIIPSGNSTLIQVGVVKSGVFELPKQDADSCYFTKRREIEWLREEKRSNLNPKLQLAFSSSHIVCNLNKYSEYIDSLYSDFYIKDNHTHLTLKINTESDIDINDLNGINELTAFVSDFMNEMGIDDSDEHVKIKLYLESPGYTKLKSSAKKLAILGAVILFFNGGGVEYNSEGFKIYTNGLFENIADFHDRWRDAQIRKELQEKVRRLEIQDPKEIERLINLTKNPRNSY